MPRQSCSSCKKLVLSGLSILTIASGQAADRATASKPEFLNSPQAEERGLPFSEAVRAGDFLFLAGQIGDDRATGKLVPGGIVPEARQTLQHIKDVLERNGSSLADVVKCTVFLADIGEWAAFNTVYREFFRKPFPARSAFGASGLAQGARVELECIAYAPASRNASAENRR
jgi:2-iminobutanoate/2-iminopropanoate deaminase